MANERTAFNIRRRFADEQQYIERYTRFLKAKSTIHDQQVIELNRILKQFHIKPLPSRGYDRAAEHFSEAETAELLAAIQEAEPEVYQTILGHEQSVDFIPDLGLDGPAAGHLDRLGEWVDFFLSRLPDDAEDLDEVELLRATLDEHEFAVDQELDEEDRIPPEALRALMATAIEHAKHIQAHRRIDALVYAREQFAEIELLARVARPDAEVNALRQGFLLLMTAFDAAVFDLVRIALRKDFFRLIGAFGKHEKISLQEIGEAGNFEALRDQLIDDQLKRRYLKDLLSLLHTLGAHLADEKNSDHHVRLIELVLRRNVHVHNRGEVDQRYLETDPGTGKHKYNLYNFQVGVIAYIDLAYLDMANRLCLNCVNRLADWAANLPPSPIGQPKDLVWTKH